MHSLTQRSVPIIELEAFVGTPRRVDKCIENASVFLLPIGWYHRLTTAINILKIYRGNDCLSRQVSREGDLFI